MKNNGFAARVKMLREQRKLRQLDLARTLGIHPIHFGRYERGQADPSASMLVKLAETFGVSIDYLLFGTSRDAAQAGFEDKELLMLFREAALLDPYDKITIKKLIGDFVLEKKKGREQAAKAAQ